MVNTTPLSRLEEPNRALTPNRARVAMTTVASPRERSRLDPRGTAPVEPLEPAGLIATIKVAIVTFVLGVHK
jgi:hypothetical protein